MAFSGRSRLPALLSGRSRLPALLVGLALLSGCTENVAVGLDEDGANRVVVALERASIEAAKEADPITEGKYRVVVAREESGRALATLRDEELPRTHYPGVLDAMDKNALVPSQAAEHAQLVAGLSGDLQRSLEGIDGVLSARVHLNLPSPDATREAPQKSSASVLLSYRGPTPSPISEGAVQRLVAGGASGLAPADVAVVMIPRAAPAAAASTLTRIGPLVVSHGSRRLLEMGLPMMAALVSAFFWLLYYTRFTRLRAETAAGRERGGR